VQARREVHRTNDSCAQQATGQRDIVSRAWAATLPRTQGNYGARAFGDLLVGPASAGDLSCNADQCWIGGLHHVDVYRVIVDWLRR